VRGFV